MKKTPQRIGINNSFLIIMDNTAIDALPGLDKAAILFQILGESLALTLFQGISESQILKISGFEADLVGKAEKLRNKIASQGVESENN